MGAWSYTLTENDSAMDYIADMEDILGVSEELYILKNKNQTLDPLKIENIKNLFLQKRGKLLEITSKISANVLVFGLFLLQLNIVPTEEEKCFIETALIEEFSNLKEWDNSKDRKNILEEFKNSFQGLYKNTIFQRDQWIRNTKTNEIGKVISYSKESNYPNGCYYVEAIDSSIFNAADCILWAPKEGELCLFWDNDAIDSITLGRFWDKHGHYKNGYNFIMFNHDFENCEPFVGMLPTFFKR